MAGLGKRFVDEGYETPKPLIEVSGLPMVIQATVDLPPAEHYSFVIRGDMVGGNEMAKTLSLSFDNADIVEINSVTEGQACTALLGLDGIPAHKTGFPVTVGACDNGAIYSNDALEKLLKEQQSDVIVWGVRDHPHAIAHPEMYGWIDETKGQINKISVKKPLSDDMKEPIVLGVFTFRDAKVLRQLVELLMFRNGRVNGEFYLDSCIEDAIHLGLKCTFFEVQHFLCWGTPNDLKTFQYWQSCFHKWKSHCYDLTRDHRVPRTKISEIELGFREAMTFPPSDPDD
jgi:bifunctional N-acetylglucosamine-1-phosphate-uridyltransferase/glucosamine-1-phosphate-acetyltransferase GlmU-like protein